MTQADQFMDGSRLSKLLKNNVELRLIEPHIYSVLKNTEPVSPYDQRFGNIYDWVACHPWYNRIVWGYSTSKFASVTYDALFSSKSGWVLDLGCGSPAFTDKTYMQCHQRPIILLDQSLKL